MLRRTIIIAAVLLAIYALPAKVQAQVYDMYSRPAVSPYLNLLQGPNQFGVNTNYQTLVKPLEEGRKAALSNRAAIQRLQQRGGGRGGRSGGPGGGLNEHFMNYTHYYSGLR